MPHFCCRCHVVERLCECEDSQWEEISNEIPEPAVSQKTGVAPCECHGCEDFVGHSSLNVSLRDQTRCITHDYKEMERSHINVRNMGRLSILPKTFKGMM